MSITLNVKYVVAIFSLCNLWQPLDEVTPAMIFLEYSEWEGLYYLIPMGEMGYDIVWEFCSIFILVCP